MLNSSLSSSDSINKHLTGRWLRLRVLEPRCSVRFLGWLAGADFESDASSVRLSAKEQETNTQS